MYRYAQIDENNICVAVSQLSGEVNAGNLIPISWENPLGMRYENGTWVEVPQVEPEPTEEEIFKAELLLNQVTIMNTQAEQDEVLAEILLNQL